jgi:uncharacterized membrane protein YdjX (TVP38/TMEM64 family)
MKPIKHFQKRRILYVIIGILITAALVYLVYHGYHLRRRNVIQMQTLISSYHYYAPIVVAFLIFISTVIPPLPLPVPLVEIASGAVFGFWESFIVVWISQIISSLFVFCLLRYFHKRFYGGILKNKFWDSYRQFLNQKGAMAVFILRTTLSAPFNIVSFLAGLSNIKTSSFVIATVLGTISEALLYSFIGSQIRTVHFSFKLLSLLIIAVGVVGFLFTFISAKFLPHKDK